MCTVIIQNTPSGFILAGNRDELRTRARAVPPALTSFGGVDAIAPLDPDGGGTWTAVTRNRLAFSLLNFYENPYVPEGAPLSRGLVIPELAAASSLDEALEALAGISVRRMRAFNLQLVAQDSGGVIHARRAVWDGFEVAVTALALPALAVSSGVNLPVASAHRAATLSDIGVGSGLDEVKGRFSAHHPRKGFSSVCMHGLISTTVSHTQIEVTLDRIRVRYFDGQPCKTSNHDVVEM